MNPPLRIEESERQAEKRLRLNRIFNTLVFVIAALGIAAVAIAFVIR